MKKTVKKKLAPSRTLAALLPGSEFERSYYLANPSEAYEYLVALRARLVESRDTIDFSRRLLERARFDPDIDRALEAHKQRVANLDSKQGAAANSQRAKLVDEGLRQYVAKRLSENPQLLAREIANEAFKLPWAKKNKQGEPFTEPGMRKKLGPMVTKEKAARRSRG